MDSQKSHSEDEKAIDLNQALVDDLKDRGLVYTPAVEAAFRSVLRHLFLPGTPLEEVYSDRAISAKQDDKGQWMSSSSQPAIMAIMLEQLGLQPGQRVLEIGTGPGYNAALLAHIVGEAGKVVTLEIEPDLTDSAREHLAQAGFEQVQVVCADGGYGFPPEAPYDRIILTVGAPDITPAWWQQLKPDGRLVLPLVLRGAMKSIAFEPAGDRLASLSVSDCGFIALRGDFASEMEKRIPLGPEPGLYVEPLTEFPIDAQAAYQALSGSIKDWPAGVDVVLWDLLSGSLWTWLTLHEPRMCRLVAEGEEAGRNHIPSLVEIEDWQRPLGTAALLGEAGLAAFTRPPGQPVPRVPSGKLFIPDSPAAQSFSLYVRQFGPDESTVQRLLGHIQDWKVANPSSNAMRIRAYPKDIEYHPSSNEIVLEKPWTTLVVEWPAAG